VFVRLSQLTKSVLIPLFPPGTVFVRSDGLTGLSSLHTTNGSGPGQVENQKTSFAIEPGRVDPKNCVPRVRERPPAQPRVRATPTSRYFSSPFLPPALPSRHSSVPQSRCRQAWGARRGREQQPPLRSSFDATGGHQPRRSSLTPPMASRPTGPGRPPPVGSRPSSASFGTATTPATGRSCTSRTRSARPPRRSLLLPAPPRPLLQPRHLR
jgi:hypothetical protein